MAKRKFFPEQKDEYLGNMWGWRFSLFGLVLILLLVGLMGYRSCKLNSDPSPQEIETTK